jgi:hypothetical protein
MVACVQERARFDLLGCRPSTGSQRGDCCGAPHRVAVSYGT